MSIGGVLGKAQTARVAVKNPVGFFLDRAIAALVQVFIPVPFAGEIAVYFKGPLLALVGMGVVLGAVVVITVTGLMFAPVSLLQHIASSLTGGSATTIPLDALKGYVEPGFGDVDIPSVDPFGGSGQSMSILTAGFHDPDYFRRFGMIHEGIDLVPSQNYFVSNQAYEKVHAAIMFATTNGTTEIYTDSYGALTVNVVNTPKTLKTVYKHLKQILVENNEQIQAGTPIGVMGMTGFATAEHLHYEVRLNKGGNWTAVDPLAYIH